MTKPKPKTSWEKRIREFIIKVGSMGGRFLGEHGLIHEPTLESLVEEFKSLNSQELKREREEMGEALREKMIRWGTRFKGTEVENLLRDTVGFFELSLFDYLKEREGSDGKKKNTR